MNRYDAFVSYSRPDERLVKPVVQFLTIGGRQIFWDRQINPGDHWSGTITNALHSSSTVVVLWCCHSAQSKWVSREVEIAVAAAKPLVPVLLCPFPVQPPLDEYQWIDYRDSVRHDCVAHAPGEPESNQALDLANFLNRGVGLVSLDSADVARTWSTLIETRARPSRKFAVPMSIAAGVALVMLAAVRPFPTVLSPGNTILVNVLTALVGMLSVVGGAIQLRRNRTVTQADYRARLLGLTFESIIQLWERGELGEVLVARRRLTNG